MSVKNLVRTFLNQLNSEPEALGAGRFQLAEDVYEAENGDSIISTISKHIDVEVEDSDIVIDYDFCGDDLSQEDDETLSFWLNDGAINSLDVFLANHGFEEVYDLDGSGDGLYYGARVYRKA